MKRLVALGLLCMVPTLSGCSTQASASESGATSAFTYTTEGGNAGGPIRTRRLGTSDGDLGPSSLQGPEKAFFGDLCMHPGMPLLFATDGNLRIQAFHVDTQSGTLTAKASTPVDGTMESDDEMIMHPSGRYLYLCHNDRVTPFTLIDNDGTLVASAAATPQGATDLNHGVIDHNGQLLYVADRKNGHIWGYRIDAAGSLFPVSSQPVATVVGGILRRLVIDDSNRFLFALDDNSDQVVGYSLASDGTLESNGSKSVGSSAERHLDMVTRDEFLYVSEHDTATTARYRIDKVGNLSPEGSFSHSGGLLSLPRSLPIMVSANNTGVFTLNSQLVNQQGELTPAQGKEIPDACLDLETVVFSSGP